MNRKEERLDREVSKLGRRCWELLNNSRKTLKIIAEESVLEQEMVSSLKKSGKWEENCVEPSMKYPSLQWPVSWCYVMDLLSHFAELPHFEPLRLRVLSRCSEDHMLKYILSSSFNCLFTLLERPSEGLSLPPVGSCSSCCCCFFYHLFPRFHFREEKRCSSFSLFSSGVTFGVFSPFV